MFELSLQATAYIGRIFFSVVGKIPIGFRCDETDVADDCKSKIDNNGDDWFRKRRASSWAFHSFAVMGYRD